LQEACSAFKGLEFTRVGETIAPDIIALVNESGSADAMLAATETIYSALGTAMVLISDKADALSGAAAGPLAGTRPVVYCTGEASVDDLAGLAQQTGAIPCVGGDIESVADRVEKLGDKGVKDVLICPGRVSANETLTFLTRTRRAALNKKFRPLGCPVLVMSLGADADASLDGCAFVAKYAGLLVTDVWAPHLLVPILATRQNIYTDPQKPVQVEPRVYEVGEVGPDSPLLVTTNFSLSYYSVESEVEASRVPCRIIAVDTEGTSVLTAWAADKFNPEIITAAIKESRLAEKLSHNRIVIPGHVAVIAASLADESGWKVLVGPKEASGIGPYLKNDWKAA